MRKVEMFVFLQLLDFMTTLVGLRMGGGELSPFIRWLIQFDAVYGLSCAKLIGFLLGGICIWRWPRVISWTNYVFAGLVVWNLFNILRAVTPVHRG